MILISSMPRRLMAVLSCVFLMFAVSSEFVYSSDWSSSNVQLLHGSNYELGDKQMTVLTFEHANAWGYGDTFFFLDVYNPDSTGTTHYGEFSPRFSFGKITGNDFSNDVIKDVLLAVNFEMGQGLHSRLVGIGLSLNLPGFTFADVNLYLRDSFRDWVAEDTNTGAQLTAAWSLPFRVANTGWVFEGFFDYAFNEDGGTSPKTDNLIAAPRLLIDVAELWGSPQQLLVGFEYQIWRDKYGIDGVDEDVAQMMLKWVF